MDSASSPVSAGRSKRPRRIGSRRLRSIPATIRRCTTWAMSPFVSDVRLRLVCIGSPICGWRLRDSTIRTGPASAAGSTADITARIVLNVSEMIRSACGYIQLREIWLHSAVTDRTSSELGQISAGGYQERSQSMKRWFVPLMVAFCMSAASVSGAQIATGNISGTVSDQQGAVLPGATVSILAKSIGGVPRTTVTDAGGQFRFLNLDAATYTVTVDLPGFTKQARDVIVNTGVNANIPFTLAVGALAETVMVTGASPVVDVKKGGTSTTLTTAELEGTPQSKDPW